MRRSGSWSADRVADLEYANLDWSRQLHATPWLQIPPMFWTRSAPIPRAWRQSAYGAVNLRTTATAMAAFFSRLTSEDGPVRELLGPQLHTEHLPSHRL
ncbi:hypothetical protein [Streptomyces phaeochromogenes]